MRSIYSDSDSHSARVWLFAGRSRHNRDDFCLAVGRWLSRRASARLSSRARRRAAHCDHLCFGQPTRRHSLRLARSAHSLRKIDSMKKRVDALNRINPLLNTSAHLTSRLKSGTSAFLFRTFNRSFNKLHSGHAFVYTRMIKRFRNALFAILLANQSLHRCM